MLEKKFVIQNETGLHARAASMLVKAAGKFKADCIIVKQTNEYDCKSIMSVMSIIAKQGEEFELKVSGSDEKQAFQTLSSLIEKDFSNM